MKKTLFIAFFAAQLMNGTIIAQTAFTNSSAITINDNSAATPYPSTLNVSGMSGTITNLKVTINSLSHSYPNDVSLMLQAPDGKAYLLQSAVSDGTPVSGITYTLADGNPQMSQTSVMTGGTFSPTNYMMDIWPAPAPLQPPGAGTYFIPGPWGVPLSAPASTFASVFNGTTPNGTWRLFVADFGVNDVGIINGGWTLNITTQNTLSLQDIDFNVVKKNETVDLIFSSKSTLFDEFEIQHSIDGNYFTTLKKITKEESNYFVYTYTMAYNTLNYFRVKCIDKEGKTTFSSVKRVLNNLNGSALVYPTKFSSALYVDFQNDDKKEIILYNSLGVRMYNISSEASSFRLPVTSLNLNAGLYYLQIVSKDGESHVYPITKVND